MFPLSGSRFGSTSRRRGTDIYEDALHPGASERDGERKHRRGDRWPPVRTSFSALSARERALIAAVLAPFLGYIVYFIAVSLALFEQRGSKEEEESVGPWAERRLNGFNEPLRSSNRENQSWIGPKYHGYICVFCPFVEDPSSVVLIYWATLDIEWERGYKGLGTFNLIYESVEFFLFSLLLFIGQVVIDETRRDAEFGRKYDEDDWCKLNAWLGIYNFSTQRRRVLRGDRSKVSLFSFHFHRALSTFSVSIWLCKRFSSAPLMQNVLLKCARHAEFAKRARNAEASISARVDNHNDCTTRRNANESNGTS